MMNDTSTQSTDLQDRLWAERARISAGERPPAALGVVIDRDDGDGTYLVEYDHLPDHPGVQLRIPQPVEPFEDRDLIWMALPLVDDFEAELASTRFGSAKREVIRCLWDSPFGATMLKGRNLGAAMEGLLHKIQNREVKITTGRERTLSNAAFSLAYWGYIHLFARRQDLPIDPDDEETWLIQSTPRLIEAMDYLTKRFPLEFPRRDDPRPEGDADGMFEPWVDLDGDRLADAAEAHWTNRDGPRADAVVLPADKGYPNQAVQIIIRTVPSMDGGLTPSSGSSQQVTEIITLHHLASYNQGAWGAQLSDVMDELRNMDPSGPEDVAHCLDLLLVPDQLAVYDYIADRFLAGQAREALKRRSFEGIHGRDLINEALNMLSEPDQTHVIRQIRLLVAGLIQDLTALWVGQIVDSWPPRAVMAEEDED